MRLFGSSGLSGFSSWGLLVRQRPCLDEYSPIMASAADRESQITLGTPTKIKHEWVISFSSVITCYLYAISKC